MATRLTVKGQVTLPKAAREAAGIRPGDKVTVRVRPEGGLIVEREAVPAGGEG
jgi:antitoxin PrlF